MASVPQIIRSRRNQRKDHQHSIAARLGYIALALGIITSIFFAITIITITITYSSLTLDLPSPEILPSLFNPTDGKLLQPSRIFDRSGEVVIAVLENKNAAGHRYLPIGEDKSSSLSSTLIQATIASSDPGIWNKGHFQILCVSVH